MQPGKAREEVSNGEAKKMEIVFKEKLGKDTEKNELVGF